jgi:hypothetical protein
VNEIVVEVVEDVVPVVGVVVVAVVEAVVDIAFGTVADFASDMNSSYSNLDHFVVVFVGRDSMAEFRL